MSTACYNLSVCLSIVLVHVNQFDHISYRSIDIFAAPNLLLLCTIHVHHKLINCLRWYPHSGFPTTDQSQTKDESVSQSEMTISNAGVESNQSELQQRYWLASGSNDPHVHVYDLGSVLGKSLQGFLQTMGFSISHFKHLLKWMQVKALGRESMDWLFKSQPRWTHNKLELNSTWAVQHFDFNQSATKCAFNNLFSW